jgi:hypothetical protein
MSKYNNLRSSQLLSPFGIGQIVNFPGELSLMICGLNLWDNSIALGKTNRGVNSINENELRFNETRLQKALGVKYFVKPFEFKTSGAKNNWLSIPAVRFPGWHYCTSCGRMREEPLQKANTKIECTACWDSTSKFKSKMIPVRFVAACSSGHIQDVPFKEWVHNGAAPSDGKHELSYHTGGGSGDLGSIHLKCTCGLRRSLAGLMNIRKEGEDVFDSALARIGFDKEDDHKFDKEHPNNSNPVGQYCKGHRPWLGLEGINDSAGCGNHLQVLVRGASNVHFSDIESAIFLPEGSESASEYVVNVINEKGIETLRSYYEQEKNGTPILSIILSDHPYVKKGFISKDDFFSGVINELLKLDLEQNEAEIPASLKLRFEEYEYILKGRNSENSDFKAIVKTFDDYLEKELLGNFFECVVLVERLKETRVFKGFSRINPNNKSTKQELSIEAVTWLPAVEVYGEGIFLKFKDDIVDEWLDKFGDDFKGIEERYQDAMRKRRPQDELRVINPFFVAMHTFAHLLIKRLCYDCGYGSSSLRERLYFSADQQTRMNGILIYTSSGDSEGSLGGLVRQGKSKNLGRLLKNAIEEARWCSADPVCSDIGNSSGQGPDNINGSACHNCCILPETCCEEFNTLLDRTTIIGSLDNKEKGFFYLDKL